MGSAGGATGVYVQSAGKKVTDKDYSSFHCPRCLGPLPANGSHWNTCREYEADSGEAPLTKLEAHKAVVERLDLAVGFAQAKLTLQQRRRDKAQAALEKFMLESL